MTPGRGPRLACLLAALLAGGALAAGEGMRTAQAPVAPASAAQADDAGRVGAPRGSIDEACRERWRAYERSQACFMPYITTNGIKPEAFQACGPELLDPSPDCGPPPQR